MLRLLHTADWHLGQTLRGFSRHTEHQQVLNSLIDLAQQHQPHAFIIAGDIFDSPNPSAEAQRLFYKTLVQIHTASPNTTTIITAGNHDAASRLEAPRDLLSAINVHVVGNIRRHIGTTLAAQHLIPILNTNAEPIGHVLAVSYPTAACLPASDSLIRSLQTLYLDLVNQTRPQWQGLPLILTGHLHVSGSDQSEGAERSILIGGENAFPAHLFPPEATYIALGHLHKPQRAGANHIRYSGSLIPLSASEIDYTHGVTLVEIDNNQLTTNHLPLPRPLPFLRIPQSGYATYDEVTSLLNNTTPHDMLQPFAQVRLRRAGLPPTFREDLDTLAESRGLRLVETRVEDTANPSNPLTPLPSQTISDYDPAHFFELAFKRTTDQDPTSAHRAVFHQILEQAQPQ